MAHPQHLWRKLAAIVDVSVHGDELFDGGLWACVYMVHVMCILKINLRTCRHAERNAISLFYSPTSLLKVPGQHTRREQLSLMELRA